MSGLASLTAQYTDSENEETPTRPGKVSDALNRDMQRVLNAPPVAQLRMKNLHNRVEITPNGSTGPLVAYDGHDSDGGHDDNESDQDPDSQHDQPLDGPYEDDLSKPIDMDVDSQSSNENEILQVARPSSPRTYHRELFERGPPLHLPPPPLGKCSEELQSRIAGFCERTRKGLDMLSSIQKKKTFRNPSIYEKLLVHCDIDELGSNFPTAVFDPHIFKKESFYDELSRKQVEAMSKHEKKKAESTGSSTAPAKKSKWDQGAGSGPTVGPVVARGVAAPGLVTMPTGTKSVVISGMGTLPKPKNPVTHVGTSMASRR